MSSNITLIHGDCMEAMKAMPDKAFDLAIVDPPYGLGDKLLNGGHTGKVKFHELYALSDWDDIMPEKEYFIELERVSSNRIIWGGNYFLDFLGKTRGVVAWDKNKGDVYNFSHWEMAWTSFDCIARLFKKHSHVQGTKIHPTQKPVALYKWLLKNYAKDGNKILDTHLGSGSIAIACYDMGYDLVGYEIDLEYYDAAIKRLDNHKKQLTLF